MNSFYFDKMHMLYNQNKSCVKSCQKHCVLKNPIVFQKKPLFSNMCTFLSHCFETKNYHCIQDTTNTCGFPLLPVLQTPYLLMSPCMTGVFSTLCRNWRPQAAPRRIVTRCSHDNTSTRCSKCQEQYYRCKNYSRNCLKSIHSRVFSQ